MIALSVILIPAGQTSVQHLVMLHRPRPVHLAQGLPPIAGVQRVHVQLGVPDEVPRPGIGRLVVLVVADHVADVLAQPALDALAELLAAVDVGLGHPVLPGLQSVRRGEGRHPQRPAVVDRYVGDQVADHGVGAQRGDRDRPGRQRGEPGHAQQLRAAVDLGAARAALAGLAVPPDRQVPGLGGLQPVQHVQNHLALVHGNRVVREPAAGLVAAPHPQVPGGLVRHRRPPFRTLAGRG